MVETLGSQTHLFVRGGNGMMIASVDPDAHPAYEEEIFIRTHPDRVHFFDADGQRCQ